MSHDAASDPNAKLIRMANQIGTFFRSKPHQEGVEGVAEHINKFWEPRMRRQFFQVLDGGGDGLLEIVKDAAALVRRPAEPQAGQPGVGDQVNAGAPGGKGVAAGESVGEIARSQG